MKLHLFEECQEQKLRDTIRELKALHGACQEHRDRTNKEHALLLAEKRKVTNDYEKTMDEVIALRRELDALKQTDNGKRASCTRSRKTVA